jgi:hypothetical protein
MKYITCQPMIGGMSRVVHILSIKLGMALSCITPAKYDAKGAEKGRRFILDDLLRDVTGRTLTHQGAFHRHIAWLSHIFRINV